MELYKESQQFRQAGLLVPLGIFTLVMFIFIGRRAYLAFTGPPPTMGLVLSFAVALIIPVLTMGCLLAARFNVTVSAEGISYRFFPFHLSEHRIPFTSIANSQVIEFRPLADFGGYGIRYGKLGKAYIVRGSEGVQLTLKDGSKLVIGSQRAAELAAAIKKGSTL